MSQNAAEQLNRIVQLVAEVSRDPQAGDRGVPIDELAQRLGATSAQVRQDLRTLTAISDESSAEWLQSLSVWQEGDRVAAVSRGPYRRPLRFTPDELLAIRVGLALEGSDGEALATRLGAALQLEDRIKPAIQVQGASFAEARILDTVDRAMASGRTVSIKYAGARDRVGKVRSIEPHQVASVEGRHYIIAWCLVKNDWRHFRVDRVLDASIDDREFIPRVLFEPVASAEDVFRSNADGDEVTVRFSSGVARWLRERFPEATAREDGALDVTYRVVEPDWLVAMVLQYGAEAEVIAPAPYRDRMAAAAGMA